MSARQKFKLDELGTVGRGKSKHRPRNDPSLYGGPYPFFQTGDVKAAELYLREYSQTYSDAGLAQSKLWQPGTLCITIAANVADTAILAIPGCFPDSVVGFIANPEKADARFIKYYIDVIKRQMVSASKGTTQDNLSVDKLLTFDFEVPLVCEQTHIADIISAYDDLIENNTRRIAVLEEMARRIYEEWFVHFRYPGHEQDQKVETELGLVPEGWAVKPFGVVAEITMGLSPKSDTYNDGGEGVPLVNGPVEFGERFTKRVKWTTSPSKLCKAGDLIVCVRASTGKYVKSDGVYCLGRGVCSIRGEYQSYIDQLFLNELPRLLSQTSGSTFSSWTGPQLKEHLVLVPTDECVAKFDSIVKPMKTAVRVYSQQIDNLRQTRDLLLPRLISGELDVSTLVLPDAV